MKHIGVRKAFLTVLCVLAASHCDLGVVRADFIFGAAENLGPAVNGGTSEAEPGISADGLSIYYSQGTTGVYYGLWVARRPAPEADWTAPTQLSAQIHGPVYNGGQHISSDGLTLYYSPMRSGEYGGPGDLWITTRMTQNAPWSSPVNLGPVVNSASEEWAPSVTEDELSLCFMSNRPGGHGDLDLWITTRSAKTDAWLPPTNLGPTVNLSSFDGHPSISADGLAIFFQSTRPGGLGNYDLWITTRQTTEDAWTEARNLGPLVNSTSMDGEPSVSGDGSMLYFSSNRPGGYGNHDLWQAPIIPIVDFNNDGKIGLEDLLRLIECWGQNEPAVDIGPMPWGDGTVDAKDLEVLMSYWGQEIVDPTLMAHWKLDEAEGIVAADSAGENDGTVQGEPLWRPAAGKVLGALELNGVDDCILAGSVLSPGAGPFSVLAWVKGGAPGQVILSQAGGANWLVAAAPDGALTTELKSVGRMAKPLASAVSITDGAWHRVGFTWDGTNRILYVDGVAVAGDTQTSLAESTGGLCIGAGRNLEAGTFWSGLIDDVRIYNRAVEP